MKKWMILVLMLFSAAAQAKLSDQQSIKCIHSDQLTKSAFQDLQAAYQMRIVTTQDFLKVMESPKTCGELKKELRKLHASAVSSLSQNKRTVSAGSSVNTAPRFEESAVPDFTPTMPSPPAFPPPPSFDDGFEDDFQDYR